MVKRTKIPLGHEVKVTSHKTKHNVPESYKGFNLDTASVSTCWVKDDEHAIGQPPLSLYFRICSINTLVIILGFLQLNLFKKVNLTQDTIFLLEIGF